MSVAQRLIKKGFEDGFEKGVNIGIELGRAMRDRELVQQFFSSGQDLDSIAKLLDLDSSTVQRYLIAEAPQMIRTNKTRSL